MEVNYVNAATTTINRRKLRQMSFAMVHDKQPAPGKKGSEKKERIHWEKSNIHPSSDFDLPLSSSCSPSSKRPAVTLGLVLAWPTRNRKPETQSQRKKKRKDAGRSEVGGRKKRKKGGGQSNNGPEHCKKVGQPQIARGEWKEEEGRTTNWVVVVRLAEREKEK